MSIQISQQFIDQQHHSQLTIKTLTNINNQLQQALHNQTKAADHAISQLRDKAHQQYQELRHLYIKQFETLKEKINVMQAKEDILVQEIKVLRDQVASKDKIISTQNQKLSEFASSPTANTTINQNPTKYIVDLQEQRLQNTMLQSEIKQLRNQIKLHSKQIQEHENTISVIKQEIQCQQTEVQYYKNENAELVQEIQKLKGKLSHVKNHNGKLVQEENNKWWKINENLLNRIKNLEQQSNINEEKWCSLYKENEKLKELFEREKANSKNYLIQIGWYKELLSEAKGEFLSNQLSKETITKKLSEQKHQLAKQNKKLKEELSCFYQSTSHKSKENMGTNAKTFQKSNMHNQSRSPLHYRHNISGCSVADFDKQIGKTNSKTPQKSYGSLSTTHKQSTIHNKSKIKGTPKK